MLIGLEKRFVFVANTKTASTSIEKVLDPHADIHHGGTPQRKHVTLFQALSLYKEGVFDRPGQQSQQFFKFGVMRDPLDWISSWFRYRKGNRTASPIPAEMSFAEFWAQGDWNTRRSRHGRYLQMHMFARHNGDVLADAIIPYEHLSEMFAEICDLLGVPGPLPRENVSRIAERPQVPEAIQAELERYYAPDFALRARLSEINREGLARLRARRVRSEI